MGTYRNINKDPDPVEFWKRVQARTSLKSLQDKLGYPPNSNAFPMYKQRNKIPSYEKVQLMANALNCSVEMLLYGADPPNYDNLSPTERQILRLMRNDVSFLSAVTSLYIKFTEKNS